MLTATGLSRLETKRKMSFSLTLSELANIAIGTPEAGNVNFNALHILLHSILEHLQLQDIRKEILEEEKDFLKPSSGLTLKKRPTQQADMEGKSSSLFHQMQQRLGRIESQLIHLNDTPSTAELLTRSQSFNKPAEDMWQMMQLKKKMEMNEEGMTKVRNPSVGKLPLPFHLVCQGQTPLLVEIMLPTATWGLASKGP